MNEALKNIVYYKLAIWKLGYGSFAVLVGAIPATIMNWYVMNGMEKSIAIGGLMLSVLKFIDGFIDQSLARLMAGKPLVSIGDTQFIRKESLVIQAVPEPKTAVAKG